MRRIVIASLMAPLWAPFAGAVIAAFFWHPSDLGNVDPGTWILMAAMFGALYGYAAILAVGLPAHILLQRWGHRSVWAYLTTFFVCELIIWAAVYTASYASNGPGVALSILAGTIVDHPARPIFFGLVGAAIGVTFWMIARPDRKPSLIS